MQNGLMRMNPTIITRLALSVCTIFAVAVSTWLVLKLREVNPSTLEVNPSNDGHDEQDLDIASCKVHGKLNVTACTRWIRESHH